jgi:predicted metal-dependent hydrolase
MNKHFDWTSGLLAEGLRCYRSGQFFEAHEHWETVWLTLSEPEKSFLQALIQITAAFHHLHRCNRTGTISLLGRALRRLDSRPAQYCGLDLDFLRKQVRLWLQALTGEQQLPAAVPEFRNINS